MQIMMDWESHHEEDDSWVKEVSFDAKGVIEHDALGLVAKSD